MAEFDYKVYIRQEVTSKVTVRVGDTSRIAVGLVTHGASNTGLTQLQIETIVANKISQLLHANSTDDGIEIRPDGNIALDFHNLPNA